MIRKKFWIYKLRSFSITHNELVVFENIQTVALGYFFFFGKSENAVPVALAYYPSFIRKLSGFSSKA